MSAVDVARNAERILLIERNLVPSLEWMRNSAGLDVPKDFPERRYAQKADGKVLQIVSNGDMAKQIISGEADFGLMGTDKFGEISGDSGIVFEKVGVLTCRFAVFVPSDEAQDWDPSEPRSYVTSNPKNFAEFAESNVINVSSVRVVAGKVEGYVASGMARGGFDVAETDRTIGANGAKIVAESPPIALGGLWLESRK